MEVKKLDFGETLKDSVAIGVKNAGVPGALNRQKAAASLRRCKLGGPPED